MRSSPDSTISKIMKELNIKKGSGYARLDKKGNLAVEQVIKIAIEKMDSMNSYTLKNAVKEVAGACVPIGVVVEGMHPKEFCKKVDKGEYDTKINNKTTKVSDEKKTLIKEQFKKVQKEIAPEYEALQKKLEAKAQKEAMKKAKAA